MDPRLLVSGLSGPSAPSPHMLQLMSISAHRAPEAPEQSFEEVRIQDYLQAYQTTGRPPQPCPQEPTGTAQRQAMGLLPLFQPLALPEPGTEPKEIPPVQLFRVIETDNGERFQCISADPDLRQYSMEYCEQELRMNAYARGAKFPQPGTVIPAEPSTVRDQGTVVAPSLSTSLSSPATSLVPGSAATGPRDAFRTNTTSLGTPEYMMSVTASQKFEGHSFEELHMAFLQHGRELTTSEIISAKAQAFVQQQAPAMGSPMPSASGGGVFGLSTATAVKPFT